MPQYLDVILLTYYAISGLEKNNNKIYCSEKSVYISVKIKLNHDNLTGRRDLDQKSLSVKRMPKCKQIYRCNESCYCSLLNRKLHNK